MSQHRCDALSGIRVALLESRMGHEMGQLVRRYGGTPRLVPALREAPADSQSTVTLFLDRLSVPARRAVVFLTGAGAEALFAEADRQQRLSFLRQVLARATLVCRGPKPVIALKRHGLVPAITARAPYTSLEVIDALRHADLTDVEITLIHYGERNETLAASLRARSAHLNDLLLYEWRLPLDTEPMKAFVRDVLDGSVDAVVFSSQVQGRHLLLIAEDLGLRDRFVCALNTRTVVAAMGPVCRDALESAGIRPTVVPDNPKMAPLIAALAQHFAARQVKS